MRRRVATTAAEAAVVATAITFSLLNPDELGAAGLVVLAAGCGVGYGLIFALASDADRRKQ